MQDIVKMVKIDYFSIRPYFTIKNMVIFVGLSFFYSYLAKNPAATFSMPIIFALMFSGYPFLVGDESGIDALYRIFGIQPKHVVYGRYIYALLLSAVCAVLGMALFFLSAFLFHFSMEVQGMENNMFISFLIILFVVAVQYPLYFKYGYTKAKTLAIIPFMLFGIIALVFSQFEQVLTTWFLTVMEKQMTLILFLLFLGFLFVSVIVVSIFYSKKVYEKREF